jgi:hypothetical protein
MTFWGNKDPLHWVNLERPVHVSLWSAPEDGELLWSGEVEFEPQAWPPPKPSTDREILEAMFKRTGTKFRADGDNVLNVEFDVTESPGWYVIEFHFSPEGEWLWTA